MTIETKKAKRSRNWLLFLQLFVMLGTVGFLIVSCITNLTPSEFDAEKEFGNFGVLLTSMGISLGITTLLLIVVGHKVRGTLWMMCLLLGSYLYGTTGMWIVFGIWSTDEYILYPLYKCAQTKVITNKELDKRC